MDINEDMIGDVTSRLWVISFRKPGLENGEEINAVVDAYGETVADAVRDARAQLHNNIAVTWVSPVVEIRYMGRYNLLTMKRVPDEIEPGLVYYESRISKSVVED